MTVLFFWCLLLSALDGYLVFAYDTELDESFHQKWVYFLGGYMALYTISAFHGWPGSWMNP